jgi:hypothetical protein
MANLRIETATGVQFRSAGISAMTLDGGRVLARVEIDDAKCMDVFR